MVSAAGQPTAGGLLNLHKSPAGKGVAVPQRGLGRAVLCSCLLLCVSSALLCEQRLLLHLQSSWHDYSACPASSVSQREREGAKCRRVRLAAAPPQTEVSPEASSTCATRRMYSMVLLQQASPTTRQAHPQDVDQHAECADFEEHRAAAAHSRLQQALRSRVPQQRRLCDCQRANREHCLLVQLGACTHHKCRASAQDHARKATWHKHKSYSYAALVSLVVPEHACTAQHLQGAERGTRTCPGTRQPSAGGPAPHSR